MFPRDSKQACLRPGVGPSTGVTSLVNIAPGDGYWLVQAPERPFGPSTRSHRGLRKPESRNATALPAGSIVASDVPVVASDDESFRRGRSNICFVDVQPGKKLVVRHGVATQLVGHDYSRHVLQTLWYPSEESLCSLGVPIMVERGCRALHSSDSRRAEDNGVRPSSGWIRHLGAACQQAANGNAQISGKGLAELLAPEPSGPVRDADRPVLPEAIRGSAGLG